MTRSVSQVSHNVPNGRKPAMAQSRRAWWLVSYSLSDDRAEPEPPDSLRSQLPAFDLILAWIGSRAVLEFQHALLRRLNYAFLRMLNYAGGSPCLIRYTMAARRAPLE